ncbi:hypothetical protein Csa_021822 [Cucumis sativus]|uniref:Uncharacterized protein n=1 Tax=Cucumis sativus TaxID=3659 RepID=A0A0A0LP88_CUCSA|nr:hypothetical protein Csa_021822 [Cucumis sativus]
MVGFHSHCFGYKYHSPLLFGLQVAIKQRKTEDFLRLASSALWSTIFTSSGAALDKIRPDFCHLLGIGYHESFTSPLSGYAYA